MQTFLAKIIQAFVMISFLVQPGSVFAQALPTVSQGGTPQAQQQPAPTQNQTGGLTSGSAAVIGQLSISFPPAEQFISATAAEINGIVSVSLAMPVSLSVALAPAGGAYSQERIVMSASLVPNQSTIFTASFSGLTQGQSYNFIIKNNITGEQSAPLQFTTVGGATSGGALTQTGGFFTYTPSANQNLDSATPTQFQDTLSDMGLVPKCGRSQNVEGTVPDSEQVICGWKDFVQLISNVIQYALILLGIIIAVTSMYAGAMIIMLGFKGDPTAEITRKRKQYGALLVRAGVGILIILLAWVIVNTILAALGVDSLYSMLST